jgi:8-oxoguanine deaminase
MTTLLVNNTIPSSQWIPPAAKSPTAHLLIRDHVIEQVGTTAELPQTADEILDLQGGTSSWLDL